MKKNASKLLLVDIDGTLIKTGSPVHELVIKSAERFLMAGNYIALSTGRALPAVKQVQVQMPNNCPGILGGGSLIYDFERTEPVRVKALSHQVFPLIEQVLSGYPDVSVTVTTATQIYNIRINERLSQRGVYEDRNAPLTELSGITDDLIKVLFTSDDVASLQRLGTDLIDADLFSYHAASRHFYEMTANGVSKGSAAVELLDMLGGKDKIRLFAAGDAASDLTIKPYAEIFFVPETAEEHIRESGDRIFPSPSDGGFAEVLDFLSALG